MPITQVMLLMCLAWDDEWPMISWSWIQTIYSLEEIVEGKSRFAIDRSAFQVTQLQGVSLMRHGHMGTITGKIS